MNNLILRNKCIIIGPPSVGKSSIVQMFHSEGSQFPKNYLMTSIPEILVKVVNIPEKNVSVECYLCDLPGNPIFQELMPNYVENANSFVLVYDVTCMDSFKEISRIVLDLKKSKTFKGLLPGAVVANKIDLQSQRCVNQHQGQEFARMHGLVYFECSAASHVDVGLPFLHLSSVFHEIFEDHLKYFRKIADAST